MLDDYATVLLGIQTTIFVATIGAVIVSMRAIDNKREAGDRDVQKQLNEFRENYARYSDVKRLDQHFSELRKEMNSNFQQLTDLINKK